MGVSGQLYHLPLPSGAEPAVTDVDLRDGPASNTGNASATTFAGKVVGDSITGLRGPKLFAASGSPIFSWVFMVTDLKGPPATTSKSVTEIF